MALHTDPRQWFREDELEICPFCGQRAVPATDSEVAVCLACEVAWTKDGDPRPI
jgi:ribosomal protein L37AE/L43A